MKSVRVTEPAWTRLCCEGPHPASASLSRAANTVDPLQAPRMVKASTPPHCSPLPLTQHHHMLETTADQRKLGEQTTMLGSERESEWN